MTRSMTSLMMMLMVVLLQIVIIVPVGMIVHVRVFASGMVVNDHTRVRQRGVRNDESRHHWHKAPPVRRPPCRARADVGQVKRTHDHASLLFSHSVEP